MVHHLCLQVHVRACNTAVVLPNIVAPSPLAATVLVSAATVHPPSAAPLLAGDAQGAEELRAGVQLLLAALLSALKLGLRMCVFTCYVCVF